MPSISNMSTRNNLKNVVETMVQDIQFTRSQAALNNTVLSFTVIPGNNWCYGMHTAGVCNCNVANSCDTKTVRSTAFRNISIDNINTNIGTINFDPIGVANIVTGGGNRIEIDSGAMQARININAIGRVQTCSDNIPSFNNALAAC